MGVQKRGDKRYEVFCYSSEKKRKVYVGSRKTKREATQLFEDTKRTLRGGTPTGQLTCREYADRWLEFKHGEGTRRPKASTLRHNEQMLKDFLNSFGDRAMAEIPRNEALDWSLKHRSAAKAVSAMFNDAVNDDLLKANPFANRQHKQMRGRKDITPATATEVDTLAGIAEGMWGEYGLTVRAWILWSAWQGTRPGETFGLTWEDIDLRAGTVTVRRVKPPYNTDLIPLTRVAREAILRMRHRTGLLFPTVTGKPMSKGASRYYWDPVRKIFESKLTPERRAALLNGRPDLDLYELRHHCASQIVARGGNEYDCAAMLGNTPEVCRETYVHEFKDERRERLRGLLDDGGVTPLRNLRSVE